MRWLTLLIACTCPAWAALSDEIETIEGERLTGTLEAIAATGDVSGSGLTPGLKLDAIRSIRREVKVTPVKPKFVIETHGAGRLLVDAVSLADDKFTATLSGGQDVVLPLDAVRSLRLEPDLEMASFTDALARPSTEQDKIFVKVEKQIDAINGLIVSLDDKELTFEHDGEERKLPRERIHGIVLAQAGEPKESPATVHLVNGSRLAGKVVSLAGGELQLELLGGAKSALSLASMERIELRSPRLAYLSESEPIAVREQTILTLAKPWQRDRSVSGKPLSLGGRTYLRGLGVHATSELVFEVPAGFDLFLATAGIDAATQGKGDCNLEVLGDGRSLWSQRCKGSDAPQAVQVELRSVKKLTLRATAGADFDFGDHVDWADARFLKSK